MRFRKTHWKQFETYRSPRSCISSVHHGSWLDYFQFAKRVRSAHSFYARCLWSRNVARCLDGIFLIDWSRKPVYLPRWNFTVLCFKPGASFRPKTTMFVTAPYSNTTQCFGSGLRRTAFCPIDGYFMIKFREQNAGRLYFTGICVFALVISLLSPLNFFTL